MHALTWQPHDALELQSRFTYDATQILPAIWPCYPTYTVKSQARTQLKLSSTTKEQMSSWVSPPLYLVHTDNCTRRHHHLLSRFYINIESYLDRLIS